MPFISVRITRDGVTREQKAQVIKEITETMERVLNKDPKLTHIVIEEVDTDNWGYAGITTTEYRQQLAENSHDPPGKNRHFLGCGLHMVRLWSYNS